MWVKCGMVHEGVHIHFKVHQHIPFRHLMYNSPLSEEHEPLNTSSHYHNIAASMEKMNLIRDRTFRLSPDDAKVIRSIDVLYIICIKFKEQLH